MKIKKCLRNFLFFHSIVHRVSNFCGAFILTCFISCLSSDSSVLFGSSSLQRKVPLLQLKKMNSNLRIFLSPLEPLPFQVINQIVLNTPKNTPKSSYNSSNSQVIFDEEFWVEDPDAIQSARNEPRRDYQIDHQKTDRFSGHVSNQMSDIISDQNSNKSGSFLTPRHKIETNIMQQTPVSSFKEIAKKPYQKLKKVNLIGFIGSVKEEYLNAYSEQRNLLKQCRAEQEKGNKKAVQSLLTKVREAEESTKNIFLKPLKFSEKGYDVGQLKQYTDYLEQRKFLLEHDKDYVSINALSIPIRLDESIQKHIRDDFRNIEIKELEKSISYHRNLISNHNLHHHRKNIKSCNFLS